MSRMIDLDKYDCDCCGGEFYEDELEYIDSELVCYECLDHGQWEYRESMSEGRLTDWERNQ